MLLLFLVLLVFWNAIVSSDSVSQVSEQQNSNWCVNLTNHVLMCGFCHQASSKWVGRFFLFFTVHSMSSNINSFFLFSLLWSECFVVIQCFSLIYLIMFLHDVVKIVLCCYIFALWPHFIVFNQLMNPLLPVHCTW